MPSFTFPARLVFVCGLLAVGLAHALPQQGELKIAETFAQASLRPGFEDREFYVLRVEQYQGGRWVDYGGQAGIYFYDATGGNKTAHQLGVNEMIASGDTATYKYIDYIRMGPTQWTEGVKAIAIERKGSNARAVIRTESGGVSFPVSKKELSGIEFSPFSNPPRASVLLEQKDPKRFFLIDKTYLGPQWDNVLIFESNGRESKALPVFRREEGQNRSYEYTIMTQSGLRVLIVPQNTSKQLGDEGSLLDPASGKSESLDLLDGRPDVLRRVGFDIERYRYTQPGSATCSELIYGLVRGFK
jgi:hypothetical protein